MLIKDYRRGSISALPVCPFGMSITYKDIQAFGFFYLFSCILSFSKDVSAKEAPLPKFAIFRTALTAFAATLNMTSDIVLFMS